MRIVHTEEDQKVDIMLVSSGDDTENEVDDGSASYIHDNCRDPLKAALSISPTQPSPTRPPSKRGKALADNAPLVESQAKKALTDETFEPGDTESGKGSSVHRKKLL